ncbi:phosphopantetheine-binding protein [Fodinicola acaciae]|uniref:phosphopantetheine-binding protein n=1 Tax=Fodinicola acaciae TaxID=2681555 RepID=UPI0013D1F796|nr:phosphopantetheine-binding protein [Fodinicola acaciae]
MIPVETLCSRLLQIPHIRDAATLADEQSDVVTVVLVRQGYRPGPVLRDLVMRAGESTGDDLVVAIVDAIPRHDHGAVDEAAARALVADGAFVFPYEAPVTETEKILAAVLHELIPSVRVSMTDDLVSIGGDSLMAVEIVGILSERLGVEMDPSQLFETESFREMAAVIARTRTNSSGWRN